MKLTIEHNGNQYRCDTRDAKSIAITMDFEGPQPNHFGAEKAKREPLRLGGFVGSTQLGGSCNVDHLQLVPHCNGTHTETISHIVNEDIWIGHAAVGEMAVGYLLTVKPVSVQQLPANQQGQSYRPPLDPADRVITSKMLIDAASAFPAMKQQLPDALLIRTLPNPPDKKSRAYGEQHSPPFFTVEAMSWILERKFKHLLVDFPSVDRMYDDGLLTNHHLFWNVEEKSHQMSADSFQDRTITEMVYIDDELRDGLYLINLQVPAFATDAAPSRPVVFKTQVVNTESK